MKIALVGALVGFVLLGGFSMVGVVLSIFLTPLIGLLAGIFGLVF